MTRFFCNNKQKSYNRGRYGSNADEDNGLGLKLF